MPSSASPSAASRSRSSRSALSNSPCRPRLATTAEDAETELKSATTFAMSFRTVSCFTRLLSVLCGNAHKGASSPVPRCQRGSINTFHETHAPFQVLRVDIIAVAVKALAHSAHEHAQPRVVALHPLNGFRIHAAIRD